MATCRHKQSDIMALLMDEFSKDQRVIVEKRMIECADCHAEYQQLKRILEDLREDTQDPTDISQGDVFLMHLHEKIDATKKPSWVPPWGWILGWCIVIVMISVSLFNKATLKQNYVQMNRNDPPKQIVQKRKLPSIRLTNVPRLSGHLPKGYGISSIASPGFPNKPKIQLKIRIFKNIFNS